MVLCLLLESSIFARNSTVHFCEILQEMVFSNSIMFELVLPLHKVLFSLECLVNDNVYNRFN